MHGGCSCGSETYIDGLLLTVPVCSQRLITGCRIGLQRWETGATTSGMMPLRPRAMGGEKRKIGLGLLSEATVVRGFVDEPCLSGLMIWWRRPCSISYLDRICTTCSSSPSDATAAPDEVPPGLSPVIGRQPPLLSTHTPIHTHTRTLTVRRSMRMRR